MDQIILRVMTKWAQNVVNKKNFLIAIHAKKPETKQKQRASTC